MNTSFNAIQNLIEKHSDQEVIEKKNTNEPVPLHCIWGLSHFCDFESLPLDL
jgi:hypothetical protein